MVWSAAAAAWLVGFVSNFLVAPMNSGMGLGDAYSSFQSGSNLGNLVALVSWSLTALLFAWLASRWSGPKWARPLLAYGIPAVASFYPSAVISNAVSHVVAIDDSFVYQDWLARPLIISGIVALMAVSISGVLQAHPGKKSR